MPPQWAGPTSQPASQPAAPALSPADQGLVDWWKSFSDPMLSSLVARAIQANLDLQLAEARIRQARASRNVAFAALGPAASVNSSYLRSRAAGSGRTGNQFDLGLDASWEIDIFGGLRRNLEAANADIEAAVYDRGNVLVTLAAEVALGYIDLRAFHARIAIAQENLATQKHTAELTRQRFQGGFVSALDVANADAQVATTASQVPLLESAAQQTIYSLSVLLALEPASLTRELSAPGPIPSAASTPPAGLPSELLRRRPDILRSEAQVHAATARVGVATADLFPKFNLGASFGYRSPFSHSWFDSINRFWSFGPAMDWQVFNTGANLANIEVQKALQEQTMLTYRKTVLAALQEVENALIALAKEQEHRRFLAQAVEANRKAVDLSTQLYTQGQTDFLNVLQAQGALRATQDALAQSDQAVSQQVVSLYKALGGGWGPQDRNTHRSRAD